jgi:hypothetical protein
MVQVDQDLQGQGVAIFALIQSNSADLGSFPNQDYALANQFLPPAQLGFTIAAGNDLTQTPLAEGTNFQWSRRAQQIFLNLRWQI